MLNHLYSCCFFFFFYNLRVLFRYIFWLPLGLVSGLIFFCCEFCFRSLFLLMSFSSLFSRYFLTYSYSLFFRLVWIVLTFLFRMSCLPLFIIFHVFFRFTRASQAAVHSSRPFQFDFISSKVSILKYLFMVYSSNFFGVALRTLECFFDLIIVSSSKLYYRKHGTARN